MKRLMLVLLALLLLSGCDLRNRQDSANYIPTGTDQSEPGTESAQAPPEETLPSLPSVGGGVIKEIYKTSGTFYSGGSELSYSYRIPFIDLQGSYVDGCNYEIDRRFRQAARDAEAAMERYETPEVLSIDYTAGFFGDVVSLEITQIDAEGRSSFAVYNFDKQTGAGVERQQLLDAGGFTAEQMDELLRQAAEEEFRRQFGSQEELSPVAFSDALERTLELDPASVTLFLTSDGQIRAMIPLYNLAGGQFLVPLTIDAGAADEAY